jgi:hypothetical protein
MNGRKRNIPKSGSPESSGLSADGKFKLSRYGEGIDEEAIAAIRALHRVFYLRSSPPMPSIDEQIIASDMAEFLGYIEKHYKECWSKHDGSFFRRLAAAMEVSQKVHDPVWAIVGGIINDRLKRSEEMPTIMEVLKDLEWRETPSDKNTVKRVFAWYGEKPSKGKPGPAPGTKQKSVHR